MKKLALFFLAALLLSLNAFAQTRMPARQVEADTNMVNIAVTLPFTAQLALDWIDANWPAFSSSGWSNIDPDEDTVASVFEWLDDNWQPDLVTTNWLFLDPAEDTAQSTFDWLDAYAGTNGLMPGTNIVGFTLSNGVWTPPDDLVGVENFSFVRDTNLTSTSAWGVEVVSNASWDAETGSWLNDDAGTNAVAFISHPPFVTADGINFPPFVTKEEFYGILNSMGFANVFGFTYEDDASYLGATPGAPVNADVQFWTVPADLVPGQKITAHLWGGGGHGGGKVGGYTWGDFVVVRPADFTNSVPYQVTNNMVLRFHVGYSSGRAAVWRDSTGEFDAFDEELLVAGGAGGVGYSNGGVGGGLSGATGTTFAISSAGTAYGGNPGTADAGGPARSGVIASPYGVSVTSGNAGARTWGGARKQGPSSASGSVLSGRGGDGYYGGASGGVLNYNAASDGALISRGAGGGGGSGFVAAGWLEGEFVYGGVTNQVSSGTIMPGLTDSAPPGTAEVAYGLLAGYPGNPGRVAFEIRFADWKK